MFVAALTLRSVERGHRYHESLHDFAEQIERLLMMVLLVFFGAAIAEGSVFNAMSWNVVAVAVLVLFCRAPSFRLDQPYRKPRTSERKGQ